MNYLDIETIQLFIYFLFFDWGNMEKAIMEFKGNENFHDDLYRFNYEVSEDVFNNDLEEVLDVGNSNNFKESTLIFLKDEIKLIQFIKRYVNRFADNQLSGDKSAFPFKKQMNLMKSELKFYWTNYNKKFNITAIPREVNNSKEANACGLKIFEFLLFLYFHKNQYVKVLSCKRVSCLDNILYLKEKYFNILLEVEFSKTIDEIFEELYAELEMQKHYRYEIITEDKVDQNNKSIKGQYQVFCKNGQKSRLTQPIYKTVFEYFVDTYKTDVTIPKDIVLKDLGKLMNRSKLISPQSLKRYLTAVNTALKDIHSGDKPYIKAKRETLIINIPQL